MFRYNYRGAGIMQRHLNQAFSSSHLCGFSIPHSHHEDLHSTTGSTFVPSEGSRRPVMCQDALTCVLGLNELEASFIPMTPPLVPLTTLNCKPPQLFLAPSAHDSQASAFAYCRYYPVTHALLPFVQRQAGLQRHCCWPADLSGSCLMVFLLHARPEALEALWSR